VRPLQQVTLSAESCTLRAAERQALRRKSHGAGHPTRRGRVGSLTLQTLQDPILLPPWLCVERVTVGHPTGRGRVGSLTLQTLQDPILLPPWLCFRAGGIPKLGGVARSSGRGSGVRGNPSPLEGHSELPSTQRSKPLTQTLSWSAGLFTQVRVEQVYKPTHDQMPVFEAMGGIKGNLYSLAEVETVLQGYCDKEQLAGAEGYAAATGVTLDPCLSDVLFKGILKRGESLYDEYDGRRWFQIGFERVTLSLNPTAVTTQGSHGPPRCLRRNSRQRCCGG
jgi:hypothetical protein